MFRMNEALSHVLNDRQQKNAQSSKCHLDLGHLKESSAWHLTDLLYFGPVEDKCIVEGEALSILGFYIHLGLDLILDLLNMTCSWDR